METLAIHPLLACKIKLLAWLLFLVATANGQCSFHISPTSPCGPEYAGFPVLTASFASEEAFDSFLRTVNPSDLASAFNSTFGCHSPAVQTLQYQTSFWCSRAAFEGFQKGCPSIAPAGRNSALCMSQCQASSNSVKSVLNDPTGCPAGTSTQMQARNSLVSMFGTACANFGTVGSACLAANAADNSRCGFIDASISCALPMYSESECCKKLLPHTTAPTFATQPSPTLPTDGAQSAANGSSTALVTSTVDGNNAPKSPLNVALISGAVVGGVVVVAACAFVAVTIYRRRQAKKALFDNYKLEKRNYTNNSSSNYEANDGVGGNGGPESDFVSIPGFPPANVSKNAIRPSNENMKSSAALQNVGLTSGAQPMTPSVVKHQHEQLQTSTKVVRVVHPYRAVLSDELNLTVGNDVIMTKEHNDGWADGIDPVTGARGVFPVTCVMDPEEASKNNNSKKEFRLSARQSSIYSKSVVGGDGRPFSSVSYNNSSMTSSANFKIGGGVMANKNNRMSSNGGGATNKMVYRVTHKYDAVLDDELDLIVGNDIIILQEFEDGWAKGMEPASGSVGLFPMSCVEHQDGIIDPSSQQQQQQRGNNTDNYNGKYASVYSKRTSSMSRDSTQFKTKSLVPFSSNNIALTGDKTTLTVIYPYEAGDSDELTLVVGRTLVLIEEFDDGWCEGRDIINNRTGIFPMACVARGNNASWNQRRPEGFAKRRSSIRQAPKTAEKRYRVIHQYTPTQSDELLLEVGKEIVLLKEFNDGWARGKNPENGKVGMMPLICVAEI